MNNKNELFQNIFVIGLLAVAGVYSILNWNSEVGHEVNSVRNPAAINHKRILDFTPLTGTALIDAAHKQLVKGAQTYARNGEFGISLGHFFMRGTDGEAHKVCDIYNQIDLQFDAEGMAVSGSRPLLNVSAACETSDDWARIRPIWIPVHRFAKEKPGDTEMTLNGQQTITLSLKNIDMSWPQHWVLTQVRVFSSSDPNSQIVISRQELQQMLEYPIIMSWSE